MIYHLRCHYSMGVLGKSTRHAFSHMSLKSTCPCQVFDDCALSGAVREEMYKCYPEARRAHLKSGGNFPYLSRCVEVNVFLQV